MGSAIWKKARNIVPGADWDAGSSYLPGCGVYDESRSLSLSRDNGSTCWNSPGMRLSLFSLSVTSKRDRISLVTFSQHPFLDLLFYRIWKESLVLQTNLTSLFSLGQTNLTLVYLFWLVLISSKFACFIDVHSPILVHMISGTRTPSEFNS